MIVAVTGHRPDKPGMGGYGPDAFRRLRRFAYYWFDNHHADKVITGMAQGWDLAVAYACRELEIPYVAAIPYYKQDSKWPIAARLLYRELCNYATETMVIADSYSNEAYHLRNRWLVEHCDQLWALWNGDFRGGTAATVRYAEEYGVPVVNLWNEWIKYA